MGNRILADVNVCLDLLLDRKPYVEHSGKLFELAENDNIQLLISGLSIDTLFYIIRPVLGSKKSNELLATLLEIAEIAPVDENGVRDALEAGWSDLEDALQFYSAIHAECTHLVTRNTRDFKQNDYPELQIMTPRQYLKK
jgi:predicted nucleic acid-binding protein